MPLTSGQMPFQSHRACLKVCSQRCISSRPLPVVMELATSSTIDRQASTNLLKAGEVQLGISAWWRALMCDSLLALAAPSVLYGAPVMNDGKL